MSILRIIIITTAIVWIGGCTPHPRYTGKLPPPPRAKLEAIDFRHNVVTDQVIRGLASFYGPGFDGRKTSNGEIYNQQAMTAAHKALPFDTIVEVTNLGNGRKCRVRINDRGPFVKGRIIDLSVAAAEALGMVSDGVVEVELRIVSPGGN